MKEVVLLTRVLLKSSKSNTKKTNTKTISKFFTFLAFLFVYMYLATIIGYVSYQAISSLMLINRQEIFLNLSFVGLLGFSIFQSIFTSLNVLFFSKDLDTLLPLPIKPYKIIMAKFNCLVVSQYIMYFVVALPILLVYGYLLNMGILYYIYSILILLIFPAIPVTVVSLLLTIIMKFTKIIKNKESVQYITAFLSIIIIFSVQFLGTQNQEITNEELAEKLIQVNESIDNNFLINAKIAVNTLVNYENIDGLKYFLELILMSIATYLVISIIASKFYIKTVTSLMNKGTKVNRKVIFNRKDYQKNKIAKTYVAKEIKTLVRNPIFFMQCVVPPFLFPLIFLIPSIIAVKNEGQSEFLIEYLSKFTNLPIGLIATLELLELFYIFNFATITSVSRDGSDAKIMKYLPIDLSKQLEYKTILGILFNVIPLIYVSVILKVILKIHTLTLIYVVILGTVINIFNNFLVIIVDLKNPKTDWMTEYAVVKQNLNMFYQMLIVVTEMGLLFLAMRLNDLKICFLILSTIFLVLIILVKRYINKNKYKLFGKIY